MPEVATADDGWITLARIVRPQGRKGEVLADLFTDFPDTLAGRKNLQLTHSNGQRTPIAIESAWLPKGRSEGRIVLQLADVDSISAAEKVAGFAIQAPPDDLLGLESGTYYIHDLVGCEVFHDSHRIGIVHEVHFATDATGKRLPEHSETLAVQKANGGEVLIPFVASFLESVNIAERRIDMRLPAGLLEANG